MVSVRGADGAAVEQAALPEVFRAPLRPDLVATVHRDLAKNARQAQGVNRLAGHQHSAESWGTGRAVSRIPRVAGSGTHAAGAGAFGNMCRGGRMFAPTKTWRKWHRKVAKGQRRYAVASALAASAVPALVMARGHRINEVPEVPLVISDAAADVSKTSAALKLLAAVGAGLVRAARNLPGVSTCHVSRLNLLQLAPGGHLGRFCIWTKGALEALDAMYGEGGKFAIPSSVVTNADLSRIINSDEIQSVVNAPKQGSAPRGLKKNPLRNKAAMTELNPYAAAEGQAKQIKSSKSKGQKAVGAAFYQKMIADSDYDNEHCENFTPWMAKFSPEEKQE